MKTLKSTALSTEGVSKPKFAILKDKWGYYLNITTDSCVLQHGPLDTSDLSCIHHCIGEVLNPIAMEFET